MPCPAASEMQRHLERGIEPCPSSQPHRGFHFQMQPDIEVVDNGMPERHAESRGFLALQFCLPECQLSPIGSGFVRVHDCTNVVIDLSL